MSDQEAFLDIITPFIDSDVAPQARQAAKDIAEKFPNTVAVLFYGSCLRTGEVKDQLLDFYVIVEEYKSAYGAVMPAVANQLLPPNVYYYEANIDGIQVRAKYALLSLPHFEKLSHRQTFSPSIWARFAQPVALLEVKSKQHRVSLCKCLENALITCVRTVGAQLQWPLSTRELWCQIFALTYETELRAEKTGRSTVLYDLRPEFYEAVMPLICTQMGLAIEEVEPGLWQPKTPFTSGVMAGAVWWLRRIQGKTLNVLRLIKASFTFKGGVDYLAWKIERHSGVHVEIKDWHRRHPIIAGLVLLPLLKGKGAIR